MTNKYLCCNPDILRFISEYANSIMTDLELKLLVVDIETYQYNDEDIYIFVQKIPDKLLLNSQNNIFLLNIEQCTRENYKTYTANLLSKNIKIIDYSLENVKKCDDNKNIYYLPYQYTNKEINKLKNFILMSDKKYDVAFIGHLSPKREKIFNELKERGIKILNVNNKWGDTRDLEVSSAKVLLNIHFADDYDIYEVLRCDRFILSSMMVISEKSIDNDSLDINELVIFENYDNLVDKVVDVIKNYNLYYKNFIQKYDQKINNIKEERSKHLIHLKDILVDNNKKEDMIVSDLVQNNFSQTNLVQNTLELFSANWTCNINKSSYVKLGNKTINLSRGFNLLLIKGNQLSHMCAFDSCIEDFSSDIQKYTKKIYDSKEYDYLILITHDDAVNKINTNILQNYLIFLDCKKLNTLGFRGAYSLIFDLKNRENIFEVCDNQFPIHEWLELKPPIGLDDNNTDIHYTLHNLGIPVYLIVYNLPYFVKNSVEQLKKYTKNIHIIDNKSTYPKLLEYYENEYEFFLHKMEANYGHLVWMKQMYWQFPKVFAMSDPDLQYNKNLPSNFLEILKDLSFEHKKGKVGFALDLSDADLFFKEQTYTDGVSIEEWEKRFWLRKIDHPTYELYNAGIDTTFCVVNKSFPETGNAIRLGGDFTCKHIPWYEGWHKKLDKDEWEFYKTKNISSSTVRMIMNTYNEKHKQGIQYYNDINLIINNAHELYDKVKKINTFTEDDIVDMNTHITECIGALEKSKEKISDIIQKNALDV